MRRSRRASVSTTAIGVFSSWLTFEMKRSWA